MEIASIKECHECSLNRMLIENPQTEIGHSVNLLTSRGCYPGHDNEVSLLSQTKTLFTADVIKTPVTDGILLMAVQTSI